MRSRVNDEPMLKSIACAGRTCFTRWQFSQCSSYTTGRNATDSSLIIDAMDLPHSSILSGFGLVSSDSDFTRLANRIREAGLVVFAVAA